MLNRSETHAPREILGNGSVKRESAILLVNQAKERKKAKERIKPKVLADYKRGDQLSAISVRYGIAPATISIWAKNAGLERRPQGCTESDAPDEKSWKIVMAVKAAVNGLPTLGMIGKNCGMTRAGIHRIFKKWKNWDPKSPFKKADKVRFMGHDYEVLEPGLFGGLVRDLKTGKPKRIVWKYRTQLEWNSTGNVNGSKVKAKRKRKSKSKSKRSKWVTHLAVKI